MEPFKRLSAYGAFLACIQPKDNMGARDTNTLAPKTITTRLWLSILAYGATHEVFGTVNGCDKHAPDLWEQNHC